MPIKHGKSKFLSYMHILKLTSNTTRLKENKELTVNPLNPEI
jgi:hypothetical protein